MNYYFDTEFIEGKQPKRILGIKCGYTKPIVDLISIGVVSQDGREYYAVSSEFNLDHAWSDRWIKDNVLLSIYKGWVSGDARNYIPFTKRSFGKLVKRQGKPNKQIATEILVFSTNTETAFAENLNSTDDFINFIIKHPNTRPRFWAYYASTDWVALYQLWGKMIDSPECYPMYVSDLKNLMDFKGLDTGWKRKNCPDPIGEHNALVDARWNKGLHSKIIETTMVNND